MNYNKGILVRVTWKEIKNNGDKIMIFFVTMIIFSPITAIIPGIYATYLMIKNKGKIEKNYLNIGLLVLFIWSLIVALINESVLSFLGSIMLLMYFSIGFLGQQYFVTRRRINKVFKYAIYLTALTAINGIIEKIMYLYLYKSTGEIVGPFNNRVVSSYGNPNMAGAWFASAIFIALYLRTITSGRKQKNIYTLCISVILIALLLTESSGAFVAFIAALICYYVLKNLKDKRKMIILGVSIFTIISMFLILQSKGNTQAVFTEINNSFSSRYDIWIGSLKMISQKPLMGWGVLATLEHGNEFFYHNGNSIHSHNIYLTFFVSTGIIGLCMYLYIKVKLFKDFFKLYKIKEPLLPLLVALNVVVIIQGLVDCSLYAPQLGILFMVTCAITFNLSHGRVKVENKRKKNSKGNIIELEAKTIAI